MVRGSAVDRHVNTHRLRARWNPMWRPCSARPNCQVALQPCGVGRLGGLTARQPGRPVAIADSAVDVEWQGTTVLLFETECRLSESGYSLAAMLIDSW
jgi:hypothetical protein